MIIHGYNWFVLYVSTILTYYTHLHAQARQAARESAQAKRKEENEKEKVEAYEKGGQGDGRSDDFISQEEWDALEAFVPADKFEGTRESYVFHMGESGLGYYKDEYGRTL